MKETHFHSSVFRQKNITEDIKVRGKKNARQAGQGVEFSFIQSYTLFINHERNRNRKNSIFSTMHHKDKRRRFLIKPHVDGVGDYFKNLSIDNITVRPSSSKKVSWALRRSARILRFSIPWPLLGTILVFLRP